MLFELVCNQCGSTSQVVSILEKPPESKKRNTGGRYVIDCRKCGRRVQCSVLPDKDVPIKLLSASEPQSIKCTKLLPIGLVCGHSAQLIRQRKIYRHTPEGSRYLAAIHLVIDCRRCGQWVHIERLGQRARNPMNSD